ncbi:hypothetical protein BJV82DRAFT_581357 [Fennellomyces sp. T-0311]|nr:hypothetical protein BJV82DRAFT_581357 [Fennellomyces sp. T-0311]
MPKAEVRRLLKQQRTERQKEKRIDHPLAKYDAQDQLMCVVCNSHVKSSWAGHLGSALHKESMARLRALKQQKQQRSAPIKRAPSPVPDEPTTKRAKHDGDDDMQDQLPADFFDNGPQPSESEEEEEEQEAPKQEQTTEQGLPQGFFDNPEEEARVRKAPPPDEQLENKLDEEYALFKEAMADTIEEAEKVDEQDDEEFWLERDEEIFRQQAEFDSRVEMLKDLRKKATQGQFVAPKEVDRIDYDDAEHEIRSSLKSGVRNLLKKQSPKKVVTVFDDMDEDDEDEEEEDDWRAQQL